MTLLNIKTVFPGMEFPIWRWWDRRIFIMGIHILVKRHLCIETNPDLAWWQQSDAKSGISLSLVHVGLQYLLCTSSEPKGLFLSWNVWMKPPQINIYICTTMPLPYVLWHHKRNAPFNHRMWWRRSKFFSQEKAIKMYLYKWQIVHSVEYNNHILKLFRSMPHHNIHIIRSFYQCFKSK